MCNKTRIRLIVFCKYFRYTDKEGQLFCQFLDLVSIPDGTATTIADAVKQVVMTKKYLRTTSLALAKMEQR